MPSPSGGGLLRDGDEPLVHVDEPVLVVPGVAPQAVRVLVHLVLRARRVLEVAPPLALDPGPAPGTSRGSHVCHTCGGLDDVVVDADDLRELHLTEII